MDRYKLIREVEELMDSVDALGERDYLDPPDVLGWLEAIRNNLLKLEPDSLEMQLKHRDRNADMLSLAEAFYGNVDRHSDAEYGGIGLDNKRPFGNSSIELDMLSLLNIMTQSQYYALNSHDQEIAFSYVNELYDELPSMLRKYWEMSRKFILEKTK